MKGTTKIDDTMKYAIAFGLVILILAAAFIFNPSASFGGADDAGSEAILSQQPDYVPWAKPLWEPPAETASMLFALQAAFGAIIIGYFIGYEKARRDFEDKSAAQENVKH